MKVRVGGLAWLSKSELTEYQLQQLKRRLTVIPRKVGNYPGDAPQPIFLFEETETHFGMARGYFEEMRRNTHQVEWDLSDGRTDLWKSPGEFHGQLRPEQRMGVDTVATRLQAGGLGGIFRAVPGYGKTVCACAMMAQLQVPTIIVVHKEFLMDQWKERIAQFLPDASMGTVQQDVCDFDGRSVVLAMVHSLAAKSYPKELYEWAGLVLYDECHRVGAKTWSVVPQKFKAKWRVGFSATPHRKDGADNVLNYHLGPLLFAAKEQRMQPKIKRVWTDFKLVKTQNFNPNLAKKGLILRFLTASRTRNRVVVEKLVEALQAGRKVIVLSERLKHLSDIEAMLSEMWPRMYGGIPSVGYYVGGKKKHELAIAKEARVILATTQYAAEGLDIPALDTLFLTTPMSDVEQAVGRILRPHEGKKDPIVVDFRDDRVALCARAGKSRDRYYDRVT